MNEYNAYMIDYLRLHMIGPFKIIKHMGQWVIISGPVKSGWFPKLSGNSKQRGQQRRALLRQLNKRSENEQSSNQPA